MSPLRYPPSWFGIATLLVCSLHASGATVVCLGDSLTAGYGLSEEEAYPALVEALAKADGLSWRVVNAGISGDTTAGGLRRVDWVLKAKPDLVLVALGGNDGLRGLPLARTHENLAAIADRITSAGAKVAIAGMLLPVNYGEDYRDGFAKLFPTVAEEKSLPLLPFLLEGVGGKPALNQVDGIHPTAEGQKLVAATVYQFLAPLLDPAAAQKAAAEKQAAAVQRQPGDEHEKKEATVTAGTAASGGAATAASVPAATAPSK